jgi:ADP-ribose pyrophosphatase YjhB (NUDIX family)
VSLPRPVRAALFGWWALRRGVTLGVRGMVLDGASVLLVRHGYVAGWHLPGGGVEPGETAWDALARELDEEAGIALDGPPELHGLFHNGAAFARDHVAVFVVRRWRRERVPAAGLEIREARFFPRDALPEGTSPGVIRRLAEVLDGAPVSPRW